MNADTNTPSLAKLQLLEAVDANLTKLENLYREIERLVPAGVVFGPNPDYEDKCRIFGEMLAVLPPIDGWKPDYSIPELNEIAQARLGADEIDEFSARVAAEELIEIPGKDLRQYRFRFNRIRHTLVQDALSELIDLADFNINDIRNHLVSNIEENDSILESPYWEALHDHVKQIDMLLGSSRDRPQRWSAFQQHLNRGLYSDFLDIDMVDWPNIKVGLRKSLYGADDPVPVQIGDLSELAASRTHGPGVTRTNSEKPSAGTALESAPEKGDDIITPRIFIIHGHDMASLSELKVVLYKIGASPVTFDDIPKQGSPTIIEILEKHIPNFDAVIALLTPDDEGRKRGDDALEPRARQNVLVEAGYGLISQRQKSLIIALGDVSNPTDFNGIHMIPAPKWSPEIGMKVARRLQDMGLRVDPSKAI